MYIPVGELAGSSSIGSLSIGSTAGAGHPVYILAMGIVSATPLLADSSSNSGPSPGGNPADNL